MQYNGTVFSRHWSKENINKYSHKRILSIFNMQCVWLIFSKVSSIVISCSGGFWKKFSKDSLLVILLSRFSSELHFENFWHAGPLTMIWESDRHDLFICVTWLIHVCDVTLSLVWRDAFICVTWLIHMSDVTYSCVWCDAFSCETWPIDMCSMVHSYVWHDLFTCVTRFVHMCAVTHAYVRRDSLICVTWLIHICDVTDLHVRHDSFTRVTGLIHLRDMTYSHVWHDSFICVTWLIQMRDTTHWYVWHDSIVWLTRHVTHLYAWRDCFIRVTWIIHMYVMTQVGLLVSQSWLEAVEVMWAQVRWCSCVWKNESCHVHVGQMHSYVWHDSFQRVTWLIYTCGMTHSCRSTHSFLHCRAYSQKRPVYPQKSPIFALKSALYVHNSWWSTHSFCTCEQHRIIMHMCESCHTCECICHTIMTHGTKLGWTGCSRNHERSARTHTHKHTHTHIHTHIYIYICKYMYIYIYMYIYVHKCIHDHCISVLTLGASPLPGTSAHACVYICIYIYR